MKTILAIGSLLLALVAFVPAASAEVCDNIHVPGSCAVQCTLTEGSPTCGAPLYEIDEQHCQPGEILPGYTVYVLGTEVIQTLCTKLAP
jgi:hypothetical protein